MTNRLPRRGQALWVEPWDELVARCQERPNEVAVVLRDRPTSVAKSVNSRTTWPYVQAGGRLFAHVRNSVEVAPGRRRGDLHLVWLTKDAS